jgi:hypothetical protein
VTEVFAAAAQRSGAELVCASDSSRDHALGSAQPWVAGLPRLAKLGGAFHPNAAGMAGIADTIIDHLQTAADSASGGESADAHD